jgi:hypothetical protein
MEADFRLMPRMTKKLLIGAVAITLSSGLMAGCATYREDGHVAKAKPEQTVSRRVRAARALARAKKPAAKYKIATRPAPEGKPTPQVVRAAAPTVVIPAAPPAPQSQPKAVPPPANTPTKQPAAPALVPAPTLPPAPQPADPLPMQPAPPPARPDPVPAPPNRANVTPPRQSGGGIAGVQSSARPDGGTPQVGTGIAKGTDSRPRGNIALAALGAARVEEARRLLARGKVAEARSLLESAIDVAPAVALLELARTYDPYYLGMLSSIDEGSEPYRAAALYQDAILSGSPAAGTDLDRLRARHTNGR